MPTLPCSLHVFEPGYDRIERLCIETGLRQFGMCAIVSDEEFATFGTILEICNFEELKNCNSIGEPSTVKTSTEKRFRVLSRDVMDDYFTAQVEWIVDEPLASLSREELDDVVLLHDRVRSDAITWIQSTETNRSILGLGIGGCYGPIPDLEPNWMTLPDGPRWLWWLTAILPFDSTTRVIPIVCFTEFCLMLSFLTRWSCFR